MSKIEANCDKQCLKATGKFNKIFLILILGVILVEIGYFIGWDAGMQDGIDVCHSAIDAFYKSKYG